MFESISTSSLQMLIFHLNYCNNHSHDTCLLGCFSLSHAIVNVSIYDCFDSNDI